MSTSGPFYRKNLQEEQKQQPHNPFKHISISRIEAVVGPKFPEDIYEKLKQKGLLFSPLVKTFLEKWDEFTPAQRIAVGSLLIEVLNSY